MGRFINKWNLPIVFFVVGTIVSIVLVLITGVGRAVGLVDWNVLSVSSVFGVICLITIGWYLVLWVSTLGKKKDDGKSVDYANLGSNDDDGWD